MEPCDINDTMELSRLASKTIFDVMSRNSKLGKPGRWRELSVEDIHKHAFDHLYGRPSKEDLEHALVRLAMALEKMEEKTNGKS